MIRLGTRRSPLAVAQARLVADGLREAEIVPMSTAGDRDRTRRFDEIGDGRGVFTGDIERALAEGVIDAAVHSAKDLTGDMPAGLVIGAMLEREDPRDAMCGPFTSLEEIPDGTRIGTSSARRTALLHELRPGLEVVPMRGNVDTRLAKLAAGDADAIVLAAAGLLRLGQQGRIGFMLDPLVFVPEAGQGAIAVQVRRGDEALVAALDHAPTRAAVDAERGFAESVGGGCSVPVAAYAWHEGEELRLRGWIAP
jgi:hydroxymethylbilane synthase